VVVLFLAGTKPCHSTPRRRRGLGKRGIEETKKGREGGSGREESREGGKEKKEGEKGRRIRKKLKKLKTELQYDSANYWVCI
jgi:hypothetical protein